MREAQLRGNSISIEAFPEVFRETVRRIGAQMVQSAAVSREIEALLGASDHDLRTAQLRNHMTEEEVEGHIQRDLVRVSLLR